MVEGAGGSGVVGRSPAAKGGVCGAGAGPDTSGASIEGFAALISEAGKPAVSSVGEDERTGCDSPLSPRGSCVSVFACLSGSSTVTGPALISASVGILIDGRNVTADAREEATSGLATIKDREVGALIFGEVRQGKVERGVDVIPVGDVAGPGKET